MVPLYFDVHIPRAVSLQLSKRGIDVLTAQKDSCATLPDHELLARATSLGRTVVTSDIRFRALAENWQTSGKDFAGLIYAHPLHVTIGRMVLVLARVSGRPTMLLDHKMPVSKERRTPIRRAFGKPLGNTPAWRFPPPMASNKVCPCAGRIGVRPSLDVRIATLADEGKEG